MTDYLRSSEYVRIERAKKIEERQRRHVGFGASEVSFQVRLEGKANTGMTLTATQPLYFGLGFVPEVGSFGAIPPAFRSGFNIEQQTPNPNPTRPKGFVGFANVAKYLRNDNGYYIGAICHVGVMNLGADQEEIPYAGYVTLSFTGDATQEPLDVHNNEPFSPRGE